MPRLDPPRSDRPARPRAAMVRDRAATSARTPYPALRRLGQDIHQEPGPAIPRRPGPR